MLQEVSIKSIVVHQGFTTKILHYTEPAALFLIEELAVDSKVTILNPSKIFKGLLLSQKVCFLQQVPSIKMFVLKVTLIK